MYGQPTTTLIANVVTSESLKNYLTKDDFDTTIKDYSTTNDTVEIIDNKFKSELQHYVTSDTLDKKLTLKSDSDHTHDKVYSKTDHTHETIKNNLNVFNGDTTELLIGKSSEASDSGEIQFTSKTEPCLSFRINDSGNILQLFTSKLIYDGPLTVSSLNGIIPANISLTSHNHDNDYAAKNHTHSDYAVIDHTHETINNNLKIFNGDITELLLGKSEEPSESAQIQYSLTTEPCLTLRVNRSGSTLQLFTSKLIYDGPLTVSSLNGINPANISLTSHNHDDDYAAKDHTHETIDNNLTVNGTLTAVNGCFKAFCGENDNNYDKSDIVSYIQLKRSDSTTDYEWRIYALQGHDLHFVNYLGNRSAWISTKSNSQMNKTITHNAPIDPAENISNFNVGRPVFMNDNVYKLDENGEYSILTDSTNCIPGVVSKGTFMEFLGICTAVHPKGSTVTVGDVMKNDIVINQDTIDFATHGDFYMHVSSIEEIRTGDTILYDGTVLDENEPITTSILRKIVGVVTGIVDNNTLAVFKA